MKKLIIIVLALFVCACAKKPAEKAVDDARDWELMQHAEAVDGPFRDQLSLRFGDEGNTRRVTAILWGNDTKILRLDVMAGVGATIANVLEEPENFVIYTPRDNKAYGHKGADKPLLRIGDPLPFTLARLSELLNGHYAKVFGKEYEAAEGNGIYKLKNPPGGTLILNNDGVPRAWKDKGWSIDFTCEGSLPKSLKMQSGTGKRAIILVKGRETPENAFGPENLQLIIPEDVQLQPLSRYREPE